MTLSITTSAFVGGGQPVYVGTASTDLVGMYGAAPVAQRASSVQASSAYATSSAFGATQLAWQVEVTDTLVGLGIWKGSA